MNHQNTTRTALYGVLLAGLVGFSTAGMAQTNAIEALNTQGSDSMATTVGSYPQANQLATALDEYNEQDRAARGPESTKTAGSNPQGVTAGTRQLAAEIDTYNADANADRVPATHLPADAVNTPVAPVTQQIAANLTRFNRSGGSLR